MRLTLRRPIYSGHIARAQGDEGNVTCYSSGMPATPQDWNVVVNGAWNLAILTPSGISRRLLQLPEGTPIQVLVSVDQPGAIRIGHEGSLITPSSGRLFVEPSDEFTVQSLTNAAVIAQRALQSLPETPVSAAGVNIKFGFDALPDTVLDLVASPLDDALADGHYTIEGRHVRRTVQWQDGLLNIEIDERNNASGVISFNFHRASTDPQALRAWLGRVSEMIPVADTLMATMTEAGE
ncbi:MAG TPA: hypothetical protein VJQ52_08375 [Steroidobacteraceae bacterium]|nr:hypothetical protein [Steroidobacteraceae bacterium]